jgi:hypothetical protein
MMPPPKASALFCVPLLACSRRRILQPVNRSRTPHSLWTRSVQALSPALSTIPAAAGMSSTPPTTNHQEPTQREAGRRPAASGTPRAESLPLTHSRYPFRPSGLPFPFLISVAENRDREKRELAKFRERALRMDDQRGSRRLSQDQTSDVIKVGARGINQSVATARNRAADVAFSQRGFGRCSGFRRDGEL